MPRLLQHRLMIYLIFFREISKVSEYLGWPIIR